MRGFSKLLASWCVATAAGGVGVTSATETMPSKQATRRSEWVNKVAEDYAGVAAGVEIDRRCTLLSPADKEKLERDLEAFTQALKGQIRADFLAKARDTSKEIAAEEPYSSCGTDARQAVSEAQEFVAWWLDELKSQH